MAAIGIDLGTAYSRVAVWSQTENRVEVIKLDGKRGSMPSYVAFTPNGRLFGAEAKENYITDPKNTVFGIIRLIGRAYIFLDLQEDMELWSFSLTNQNGTPKINVMEKGQSVSYTAVQVTAMLINRLKEAAEQHIKGPVAKVVISVPPFFTGTQKKATRQAAEMAGLQVLRITDDCIAAAVAHRLFHTIHKIIVFDLGATMSNVSLLAKNGTIYEKTDTKCYKETGGQRFDSRLALYFANDFEVNHGKKVLSDETAMRRLTFACEKAKWVFTDPTVDESIISLPNFFEGIDYENKLTREILDALLMDHYVDSFKKVDSILKENKVDKTEVQAILGIGGSGKLLTVKQLIADFFDRRLLVSCGANPDEVTVIGAAIQAALLNGISHPSIDHRIIPDVLPMSLGIDASHGVMIKFLLRNEYLPCEARRVVPLYVDSEHEKVISVFEGERVITEHNHLVMKISLPIHAEYNVCKSVIVYFAVNYEGKLKVHIKYQEAGVSEIFLHPSMERATRMTPEKIREMLATPQSAHEEDLINKARLEARYKIERYISDVGHAIKKPGRLNTTELNSMLEELEVAILWLYASPECTRDEYENKFLNLSYRWVEITHKIFDRFWCYRPFE